MSGARVEVDSSDVEKLARAFLAAKEATLAEAKALGLTVAELGRVKTAAAAAAAANDQQAAAQVAAAASAKSAETAAKNYRFALVGVAQQTSDIASQLSTGTNPWTILIQQGPQVAGALSVVEGALVAVAAPLAAAAVAVTVGYLAWRTYSEDATRAAETSQMVSAALVEQAPILEATREATDRLRVARGELTDEELELEQAARAAHKAYLDGTATTRAQLSGLRTEQASVTTQLVDFAQSVVPAWTPLGQVIDGLTTSSAEYEGQISALEGTLDLAVDRTRALSDASAEGIRLDAAAGRAKEGRTAATKAAAEAERALQAAMRASLAALDEDSRLNAERAAGQARLEAARDAALTSTLTGTEAVLASHEAALEALEREYQATVRLSATDAERSAATEAYQEAQLATTAATFGELERLYARDVEHVERAEAKKTKQILDSQRQLMSSGAQLLGDLGELAADHAATVGGAASDGARQAWLASKGLALASTAVATYQAAATALATPPAPNLPLAAVATALGVAQGARIAATEPSFGDTPGPMRMEHGGRVRFAAGDWFVAAQTPQDLQRQVGVGSGPIQVVVRQRHEVFDAQAVESSGLRTSQLGGRQSRRRGGEG